MVFALGALYNIYDPALTTVVSRILDNFNKLKNQFKEEEYKVRALDKRLVRVLAPELVPVYEYPTLTILTSPSESAVAPTSAPMALPPAEVKEALPSSTWIEEALPSPIKVEEAPVILKEGTEQIGKLQLAGFPTWMWIVLVGGAAVFLLKGKGK